MNLFIANDNNNNNEINNNSNASSVLNSTSNDNKGGDSSEASLKQVDKRFNQVAQYDMNMDNNSVKTSVSSIMTRSMDTSVSMNTMMLSTISIPEEFRIDAKPFVNRPFYVGSATWDDSQVQYTSLSLPIKRLPGDIIRSNPSLLNAMKMGAYYRSKLKLNVSMAGTITHAGTILVGVIPPTEQGIIGPQRALVNTVLSGPHGFLSANEATSLLLDVPWYCNTDLASLDLEEGAGSPASSLDTSYTSGNYGTLVALVLNPLQPSDGSSKSLEIVFEAIFENLDILVPTPRYLRFESFHNESLTVAGSQLIDSGFKFVRTVVGDGIDWVRGKVRSYTGLHNPNFASINERVVVTPHNFLNAVDTLQYFEKLDPHAHNDRVIEEPIFNTTVDEMNIKHILSKKQYLGTFKVNANDGIGTLLWSRPISPYAGGLYNYEVTLANNIELLYKLSKAWRGKIKIYIQSSMNNKQQLKLRLLSLYNPSKSILTGTPVYSTALNAPSHLMEFTAGGQIQEVELPYLCRNEITQTTKDLNLDAIFHGEYYLYLAQKLANSTDSPQDVFFNVYYSCEDVSLYGYSTEYGTSGRLIAVPGLREEDVVKENLEFRNESKITVMNEPQNQRDILNVDRSGDETVYDRHRLVPLTHVRDIVRRMYRTNTPLELQVAGKSTKFIPVHLATFIGEFNSIGASANPLGMISKQYYGKSLGLKVRTILTPIRGIQAPEGFKLVAMYLPPEFCMSPSNALSATGINISDPMFSNSAATLAAFPLPLTRQSGDYVAEYEIPNLSPWKFIGAPNKLDSTSPQTSPLAAMGYLLIGIQNNTDEEATMNIEHLVGFSDESRLGFHSIAPVVSFSTGETLRQNSLYGTTSNAPFSGGRSDKIYYTRV